MFIFITIIFMIITYGSLIAMNKRKLDIDTAFNILCISILVYVILSVMIS